MGKEDAMKKLNNLHDRIKFDMKRNRGNDQIGLKDYKKMVEEIKDEIEKL